MDYFELSQNLKTEVESDETLKEKIRAHVAGGLIGMFDEGTQNQLFRIGQTKSGMWVARRRNKFRSRNSDLEIDSLLYESYCSDAERNNAQGRIVPLCVAGIHNGTAFLLVEDLSEGGKCPLSPYEGGSPNGTRIKDGRSEEVYFDFGSGADLDRINERTWKQLQDGTFTLNQLVYFHEKNRLNL